MNIHAKSLLVCICSIFILSVKTYSQTLDVTANISGPFCVGTQLQLDYTATGSFGNDNIFTAQLSNEQGSFTTGVTTIGSLTSTELSGRINVNILGNLVSSNAYRIRVVSSEPQVIGVDNGNNLTILTLPTATLSGSQAIEPGQSADLTATLTGTKPWRLLVNAQEYSNITDSPFTISVNPTTTTNYTLFNVSNICGSKNVDQDNVAVIEVNAPCGDLEITDISITKYSSDKINYIAQIKNTGNASLNLANLFLGAYTSSDTLVNSNDQWKHTISAAEGTIGPEQSKNISCYTSFDFTSDQYYFRLKVDQLGLISECIESNNDFFKLVNKCTTTEPLTLSGSIAAGYYASNVAVTIQNALIENDVLVVGRSINGSPSLMALNSVFQVGQCLEVTNSSGSN